MTSASSVHRIVESHAATHGSDTALIGRENTLTYRDLNQRGNALARYFIGRGFRRGSRAIVKMDACPDLAIVLLAVLKAGGAYTWLDRCEEDGWLCGISLEQDVEGDERRHVALDVRDALAASARVAPNLPILTRADDLACVLPWGNGSPGARIPHATIIALNTLPFPRAVGLSSPGAALDLWRPLMAGTALLLTTASTAAAAA